MKGIQNLDDLRGISAVALTTAKAAVWNVFVEDENIEESTWISLNSYLKNLFRKESSFKSLYSLFSPCSF